MNIYTLFERAARTYPHVIALVQQGRSVTYAELEAQIDQTAAYFQSRGVVAGHWVLVFVPMSIDLYRIALALFKMGATAVFLDEWVSYQRLVLCCQVAECQAIVAGWKFRLAGVFSKTIRNIPIHLSADCTHDSSRAFACAERERHDPALITFTTGSTGMPKAALRSHGFLAEQFRVLRAEIEPQPGEVDLTTLPIVLLINLAAGSTSLIADWKPARPQAFHAQKVVQEMGQYQVARITASPFFVSALADELLRTGQQLPVLRKVFTGGAPVYPLDAERMCQAFPLAAIQIAYGSTEAEPISMMDAKELVSGAAQSNWLGLPVGRVHAGITVQIIAISDAPVLAQTNAELPLLSTGQIGEIVVSGRHVLDQYFRNAEAWKRNKIQTATTLWHRTGDSGFIDAHGQLYLTGRCAQLFEHGGKLVCPFLIEGYLKNLPGVQVGTAMQLAGELYFCLELKDAHEDSLRPALDALQLGPYIIQAFDHLPRDPRHFGKLDYASVLAAITALKR